MQLTLRVPGFALAFLAVYYFLAGASSWFQGSPSGALWQRFYTRGVGAELTLVPLSLAMVLAYKHQGLFLFFVVWGRRAYSLTLFFKRWTVRQRKVREKSFPSCRH